MPISEEKMAQYREICARRQLFGAQADEAIRIVYSLISNAFDRAIGMDAVQLCAGKTDENASGTSVEHARFAPAISHRLKDDDAGPEDGGAEWIP